MKVDPKLISEIREYGDFDVTGCFNCGSCTIKCNLSEDASSTFPRKSMRYAVMGLKEPLNSSLEPWLCYYCGDCSETCPRQTEPGEAMMTLRRYHTARYDWTGLASKFYKSKAWEIGAFLVVAALMLLFITEYIGVNTSKLMTFGHSFELIMVTTVSFFIILPNAFRMYWFTMHKGSEVKIPFLLYFTELKELIWHAMTQKQFLKCTTYSKVRWIKHWFIVSGYVLMITTVVFLDWFKTVNDPIYHPLRLLGYYATGVLIIFTGTIIIDRIKKREQMHKFSDLNDWLFPIWLFMLAASALMVHIFSSLEYSSLTYYVYIFHLVVLTQWASIIVPFGKWPHLIYRSLAVYFQRVQEKALQLHIEKEAKHGQSQ